MNSTTGLLHRINDPNLSTDERARLRCQLSRQLELAWNFEAARKAMGDLWQRIGELPNLDGLEQQARAEVLLRAGSLTGWIGSSRQIEGAQEIAKNLITKSIEIFESLKLPAKISEAQIDLAYCYWREGAFDDARVILQEALTKTTSLDDETRALGVLRSAIVEESSKRLHDCLHICLDNAQFFETLSNIALKGKFHNEFGMVLKDIGLAEQRQDYIDRSLIEFAAASYYFEQANLSRHQACVENNLGFLFGSVHQFAKAHEHLDRAQALFTSLKDRVHSAQVDDTRARVMVTEGEFAKAEKLIRAAVRVLEEGGEQSLLAEALITKGLIFAGLGKHEQADSTLHRAADVAEQAGDLESAGLALLTLIEQLGHRLSNEELCVMVERADGLLEKCRDFGTVQRLSKTKSHALFLATAHPGPPQWSSFVLEEVQQRNECRYVELALKESHGSVTKAADLLGLPGHQSVTFILNRRCPHLLNLRTPIKPRRRRIIQTSVDNTSQHESKAVRPARILHVEDDETVAEMIKEMLAMQSWQVEKCADGKAALERITGDADYDLLLVDYDLPGVNGLELVQRVRQLPHRARTPIVVLSATPVAAEAREAGADVFLQKPQDVASLVETISRLMGTSEQEGREV
jgi:CheY-like chemotaxis protein